MREGSSLSGAPTIANSDPQRKPLDNGGVGRRWIVHHEDHEAHEAE
jgi:hypothetical protein